MTYGGREMYSGAPKAALANRRCTFLSVIGDVNQPVTWSGTPYYLLLAGRKRGLIDEGLNLSASDPGWAARRSIWNLNQMLRGRHYGGYQYQPHFLERLYAPIRRKLAGNAVINCFQMYAPSIVKDDSIEKWFYIDMTLQQLFSFYEAVIDRRTAMEAIERECESYHSAMRVMTLSKWAARSVIRDYGIPPERVHAVTPGANLDPSAYAAWEAETVGARSSDGRALRFCCVGRGWERKGFDRLFEAFHFARSRGAGLTLRIIGLSRGSAPLPYRGMEGVEWMGFVDKGKDAACFLRAVAECDVGCLFSRADASPIALREYCALGLVTFHTGVGGMGEMVVPEASVSIPASADSTEIGARMVALCSDRAAFHKMRLAAWQARHTALWDAAVSQMLDLSRRETDRKVSSSQVALRRARC